MVAVRWGCRALLDMFRSRGCRSTRTPRRTSGCRRGAAWVMAMLVVGGESLVAFVMVSSVRWTLMEGTVVAIKSRVVGEEVPGMGSGGRRYDSGHCSCCEKKSSRTRGERKAGAESEGPRLGETKGEEHGVLIRMADGE